jgi:hypothetical protein
MVSSWVLIGHIFGAVFDPERSADLPANAIQLVDTCSEVHGVSRGLLGDEAGQFSRAHSLLFMAAAVLFVTSFTAAFASPVASWAFINCLVLLCKREPRGRHRDTKSVSIGL